MFAGVYKITKLTPQKVFCMSVPSPTGVDYTDAISLRFEEGATGAFSGSSFVPKGYGGGYNIRVHGDKGSLFLDFEINRERFLIRTMDGQEIKEDAEVGSGTHSYTMTNRVLPMPNQLRDPGRTSLGIHLTGTERKQGGSCMGYRTEREVSQCFARETILRRNF